MVETELRTPLPPTAVHLCVDMQNMFAPGGPWATPWMERVAPVVATLAERFAPQTIFTRFMTPQRPQDMPGTWQRYYCKWPETTRARIDRELLELLPPLQRLVPPAAIIDKTRYSAFAASPLSEHLMRRDADTVIVTGSETDVCVLATVLGAVDRGLRVIIVTDAICSSSDEGHEALLTVYRRRYSEQIETVTAETILSQWRPHMLTAQAG
jgi:nicotinamidase-related amidase